MTYINRTSNIKEFPFQDFVSLNDTELEEAADRLQLRVYNSWMLPQLVAWFGSWSVVRTAEGQIDARATAKHNIGTDAWRIGIWKVVNRLRRSSLVKSQNNPQFAGYSALVPLVLSGLKKHQDIPYRAWAVEGLEALVDKNLYEAMTCEVPPDLTKRDILESRDQGLMIRSGPRAGEVHQPTSTWRLTGIKGTPLGPLPVLAQTMLAQIWVAHPSLRSPYMVLDPRDWDRMPEPLISTDVFQVPQVTGATQPKFTQELPWL